MSTWTACALRRRLTSSSRTGPTSSTRPASRGRAPTRSCRAFATSARTSPGLSTCLMADCRATSATDFTCARATGAR
eukprot:2330184-Alexandrium_andersonii.AAC.1